MAHSASLPRLSAGQIGRASTCSRHLAMLLDPERPGRGSAEPSLRLWKAVHDAIHDAHRLALESGGPVTGHLSDVPVPAGLSVEETAMFLRAVEHYDEAFGNDTAMLDPRCGEVISRPSPCGRYQLTAMANLVFRRASSPIEIRRVKLTPRPAEDPRPGVSDFALAALLRPPGESSDAVAVVTTLWVAGDATVTSLSIGSRQIDDFRASLRDRVDAALADPGSTSPGWWCGTCPFVLRCPAIPQDSPERMFIRSASLSPATTASEPTLFQNSGEDR